MLAILGLVTCLRWVGLGIIASRMGGQVDLGVAELSLVIVAAVGCLAGGEEWQNLDVGGSKSSIRVCARARRA